jgi:hypothetical protein
MKKEKVKNKYILLKGEGVNQHTLYGDFIVEENKDNEFVDIIVEKKSKLVHEKPNGDFAEHNTLIVEAGEWRMGKQVEYNPLTQKITKIWD